MNLEAFKSGIKRRGLRFSKRHPGDVELILVGALTMSEERNKIPRLGISSVPVK